jgi:hypothetical protein
MGALSVGEIQKFPGMHRSWQVICFLVESERGEVAGLNDGRGDDEHWAARMQRARRSQVEGDPEIR